MLFNKFCIIFGFFAINRASAVPIPIAIGIILPAFAMKNNGRTILLFYYILPFIYIILSNVF